MSDNDFASLAEEEDEDVASFASSLGMHWGIFASGESEPFGTTVAQRG